MTPTQRNKLNAILAVCFVLTFGFLITAMYIDSQNKTFQQEIEIVEIEEQFPLNEAAWYGFYRCEVNRIYYNLQFAKTMDAKDAQQEQAWTVLRNIYKSFKDNPDTTQDLLDAVYLRVWELEHKEDRPPNMALIHAAQSAANESCPLLWHKDS